MVIREAVNDLNRMRKIVQVLVKYGFGDLLARTKIFEKLGMSSPSPREEGSGNRNVPARVANMLCELGPIYIKMGQILSTRPDLLPDEYIEALSKLQDKAPPVSYKIVSTVIKDQLGETPEELFDEFQTEPMASASIAQVHLAKTKDGKEVAVKIKRPGIERTVRADLDILYSLAHIMETVFDDGSLYEPVAVIREFDAAISKEMNLELEAKNLTEFTKNFSGRNTLVMPEPIADLCGQDVLTMTFVGGMRLDEVEPGSELGKKSALNLIEGMYQQVFEDGLFHTDPHPGNLRIFDDGRVGMLDFGQVGRLSPTMRNTIVLFGLGVILKEPDTISRIVYRLGAQKKRVDLSALKKDIQEMLEGSLEKRLDKVDTGQVLTRLLNLSHEHRVRLPAEYVLLAKTLATIDGILRTLDPSLQPSVVAAPYVKKMMTERFSLEDVRGGLGRSLLQLTGLINDVPEQISQILLDLEGGRMTINIRDPEVTKLRHALRGLGMDLLWGLIAAGLLTGSLPSLMTPGPAPKAAIFCIAGAGLIAVAGTLRYVFSPMVRRMKLRSWLERRWNNQKDW